MISINTPASKTRKHLEMLSDRELLGNLEKLNNNERRLKVLVLLYLSEIEKRELYLPMGYSSLFDFCTINLKYTRATAVRRIRAARIVSKHPEALEMLRSGEINITTLSMIGDILDQDNHKEILEQIRHKSAREVEMLVSRHRPVPVIHDTVRPICVRRRVETSPEARSVNPSPGDSGQNLSPTEDTERRKCNKLSSSAGTKPGDSDALAGGAGPRAETKIILEERLKLGFSVSPEFMINYNKIKSLLSNKHPEGLDFETLFGHLMNEYLEKHDPERRRIRRDRRAKHRIKCVGSTGASQNHSRRIPPAVRDQVYARDKGRCSFKGPNGRRCNSPWDLEMDHIVPYARGGDNSPDNLRLLCRKHNMHQAERVYGGEFVKNRLIRK